MCVSCFVQSTIPCVPAGVFSCPLVVTMRPIPGGMLDAVAGETHLNPLAHGAPVHIGDPGINDTHTSHRIVMIYCYMTEHYLCAALLGIQDLSKPDYGERVELQPGDVPVFWACGVTAIEAILSSSKQLNKTVLMNAQSLRIQLDSAFNVFAEPPLAFSHSPGCMFLTDVSDSSTPLPSDSADSPSADPNLELSPLCFQISHSPLLYSLASKRAVAKIRELERIIGDDPGKEI